MTGILVRLVRTVTLLLVAVMASRAAGPDANQPIHCGGTATRFVCVNDCTSTGHLSSCGLFLNCRGRISPASKACFAADLGFKEIYVDALAGAVMAGAGGAAGPAPDVRHQLPGKTVIIYCDFFSHDINAGSAVCTADFQHAHDRGFESNS